MTGLIGGQPAPLVIAQPLDLVTTTALLAAQLLEQSPLPESEPGIRVRKAVDRAIEILAYTHYAAGRGRIDFTKAFQAGQDALLQANLNEPSRAPSTGVIAP